MRDRQPIASVSQLEVIDATCSSAQVPPAISIVNITPEPMGVFNPTFNPGFSPPLNNLPPPQQQPMLPIQPMPDFSQLPYPAISQPPPPFSPPGTAGRLRASLHSPFVLVATSVLGYQPCSQSSDWFVSPPVIRCSGSFAATGFAPDPKDCSKYYSCDPFSNPDGMSSGKMSAQDNVVSM